MLSLTSFLFFFFSFCLSQGNHCGWFIINDILQPLHICHQERGADASITSYMAECNQNNNEILIKRWPNSNNCNENIEPNTIIYPTTSNFNCTECISQSYLTYKTYSNNECSQTGTIINNMPYHETTLITNKCYNNTNKPYHQLITCNSNDSYSIHSYSDHSCRQLISTNEIPNTNCQHVINCHSQKSQNYITTSTTSYFTTTQLPNNKSCNSVNLAGVGYDIPTGKCLTISSTESQIYECNEYGEIKWSYYSGSMNCSSSNNIELDPYPSSAIIDWNCDSNTCSNNEFLELIVFKTENDCSIDAISDTDYDSHLFVINTCMKTENGGSVMYTCINNKGYTITKYLDSDCLIQDSTISYNEIECIYDTAFNPSPQRRQHMVYCNGINNVMIENDKDYIIDCNYFINKNVDPLGIITEPLNICMHVQNGSSLYSRKYQCNQDKSFIEEIIYLDKDCNDINVQSIIAHYEFEDFFCDSEYSCDNSILFGKQYTNDTCHQNVQLEEYWYDQYIIADTCWPIDNGLYTIISCDQNGFIYYSLYNDKQCQSLAFYQRFNTFDCIFGKFFQLLTCQHWKQEETITTTTTTNQPILTSSTSITTASMISTSTTSNPTKSTSEISISGTYIDNSIEDMLKEKEECINMFNGRDIGGISCKYWEDIIWILIVLVAGIISCFICWCCWSRDARSLRRRSKIPIPNGNNNEDLQNIVIQQLNKGQHIKINNNDEDSGEDSDEDNEQYDEVPFSL